MGRVDPKTIEVSELMISTIANYRVFASPSDPDYSEILEETIAGLCKKDEETIWKQLNQIVSIIEWVLGKPEITRSIIQGNYSPSRAFDLFMLDVAGVNPRANISEGTKKFTMDLARATLRDMKGSEKGKIVLEGMLAATKKLLEEGRVILERRRKDKGDP